MIGANGERIDSSEGLRNVEGLLPVGQTVRLDLSRAGQKLTVSATLKAQAKEVDGGKLDGRLAGASFTDLPERYRQQGVRGVIISKVISGSRANRNGLDNGDLVLGINRRQVEDLNSFRAQLAQPPGTLVLQLQRGSASGELQMR